MTDKLRGTLRQARAVLFDFDGPICSVFSGYPPETVADELRDLLPAGMPSEIAATTDPMEVMAYAQTLDAETARAVEAAMTAAEIEAVKNAEGTPGAVDAIEASRTTGRTVAYVSNNSRIALAAYLDAHGMHKDDDVITGRTGDTVSRLKPDPYLIHEALHRLNLAPEHAVFVGDSLTDVEAGRLAGVATIAYANKPGKDAQFAAIHADLIVTSMTEVADLLRGHDAVLPS